MTSRRSNPSMICMEQDCVESTGRRDHPLCYEHYEALQIDLIKECQNHPGVFHPANFPVCRICFASRQRNQSVTAAADPQRQTPPREVQQRQYPQTTGSGRPTAGTDDSRGWGDLQPAAQAPKPSAAPSVVRAIDIVRKNMTTYETACVNHETNTTQYLIMPMIKGLGWDSFDPEQVWEQYMPEGKAWHGRSLAVDIALLEQGTPKIFIEVKRLDREYDPKYEDQLSKYARYLEDGDIAVLTNGRHWLVSEVVGGQTNLRVNIDLKSGDAEELARKLLEAIGRNRTGGAAPAPRQTPPTPKIEIPNAAQVVERLRAFREREAGSRGVPGYMVLKNETIEEIATRRPNNMAQLARISGVGPATVERYGQRILDIIQGRLLPNGARVG